MRLEQIKGPFAANSTVTFRDNDANYVHIGIQVPYGKIIGWWSDEGQEYRSFEGVPTPEIEVNGDGYFINKTGILEFDGQLDDGYVTVKFRKDFPMETIVDIVYSTSEE